MSSTCEIKQADSIPTEQELVSGLSLEPQIELDPITIIQQWPELAPELRAAIVKTVRE